MTALNLALACDARYAPHASATLISVLSHGDPRRWSLHVLHGPALDTDTREAMRGPIEARGARLTFHAVDDARVASLPQMDRIGSVMWYRLLLPELLPDADRVLYVDSDVLAATDLAPLLGADLQGRALGAVRNVFEPGMEGRAEQLGLSSRRDYFNSGVLLMDLGAWRRDGWSRRVLDVAAARAGEMHWPDQDALNIAFAGAWHPLHPRWNSMNSLWYFDSLAGAFDEFERREATRAPGILHFEGPGFCKPWHALCKHPYQREYLRCRAQTAWPRVALDGDGLRARLLRLLPMKQIPRVNARIDRVLARLRSGGA